MDENQNYGYNETNYNQQGAPDAQQSPYVNQQYGQNPYGAQQAVDQQYGQNPYGVQQPADQQYGQAPYGAQQPAGPQYSQTPYGVQQQFNQQSFGQPVKAVVYDAVPDKNHGTSVAALVCGILGLVFFWVPGMNLGLCLAGLICGIIAMAKSYGGRGMAITGLVLSIIDCILTLIFFYYFVLGIMLI